MQMRQVFWHFVIFVISVSNWLLKAQVEIVTESRENSGFSKPFPNR
jgi:hypothetical protein